MVDLSHPQDPFTEHEESPEEAVAKATIKQRAGIWALGFIAVMTGILGIIQIQKQIRNPLLPKYENENDRLLTAEEAELKKIDALKEKDSDGDTLKDYDELYLYDTSPYLADSDSDGVADKEELQQGNNPNCPIGRECTEPRSATKTVGGNTNGAATDTSGSTNTGGSGAGTTADLEVIRNTLKNAGAPAEIVDQMTDEELITLYNETAQATGYQIDSSGNVVASENSANSNTATEAEEIFAGLQAAQNGGANTNTTDGSALTPEMIEALKNLAPDEIRALLIELGGDENFVNSLDDETLQAIFQQAIDEQLLTVTEETGTTNGTSTKGNTNNANGSKE